VFDAAVVRVGWLITKMGTEDLSRTRALRRVEPGTEGLAHPCASFQISSLPLRQFLRIFISVLDPQWCICNGIGLLLVPTSSSYLLDKFRE
jgi:hypothetical protein